MGAAKSDTKRDEFDVFDDLKPIFTTIRELTKGMEDPRARLLHGLSMRAEDRIKHYTRAGMSPADYANVLADAIGRTDISQPGTPLKQVYQPLQEARTEIQALLEQIG